MSRRFGRNRRRRAREEIANLAEARDEAIKDAASWNAVADRQRERAQLFEAQVATVRRVLGDTVALPPVERLMLERDARNVAISGLQVEAPGKPLEFVDDDCLATDRTTFEIMTLDVLEAGLDLSDPNALYRQPHAYLRSRETGELRYAIAPEVLAKLDERDIIQRIAHLLAKNMANDLKRRFPR